MSPIEGNASKPLTILRLLIRVNETSAEYNQLSLSLRRKQDITLCTFFRSLVSVPEEITVHEGNGSITGFFRAISTALNERDYDVIHVHSPHLGILLILTSVFLRKRLLPHSVYTVHNSYQNYKLRNRVMLYPIVARFGRVVCCSWSSLESFPRTLRWLAGKRIRVVQNGVDIERVDSAIGSSPTPSSKNRFTIVAIGRLIDIKNPLSVLMAYKLGRNGNSGLVFIGEGNLRSVLMQEIANSGIANEVKLAGIIPRDELFVELARADLFISASSGEGLPVAVLEAMACRVPVILSDIPPHREIVGDMDFIPLIQPNDIDGFADELKRFRAKSRAERSMLGVKCRQLIEERFSLRSMHEGYSKIYANLLAESRS